MFSFGSFRLPEYEADYSQNFDTTKYVAVYGSKTFTISPGLLGMLQPSFFKPFPNLLNYNNNRNAYIYILLFRGILWKDRSIWV